jgi:hypothetical protein
VAELEIDARCSRMRKDSVSIARIGTRAVLCEHQLQSWSIDTRRLRCKWLPLQFFLLLDYGPSIRPGSRLSLAGVGDIIVLVPALDSRRRNSFPNAFASVLAESWMCLTVVETNVMLTPIGGCACDFFQASCHVVLDNCFVSVILGKKLQSEQR